MYSIPKRTHNDLKLDPGIPARRNRSSGCKYFLLILVTIGLIVALFIRRSTADIWEPHASLLYKGNLVDLVDPASVVRPLIDEKQTFDIVATVWLRTNDPDYDVIWQRRDAINGTTGTSTFIKEKAIFTGTVFNGLRLKDKEIRTTVEYKVPTEIFKNRDLNHYDLRASFVPIPTSPSLLDNFTSYSSWRNGGIYSPPIRFRPNTGPGITLRDRAIDSFSASTGLLSFSGTQSRCAPTTTSNTTSASDRSLSTFPESSTGKPVLESHPYIISRSFLLAADRTKPYYSEAYNRAHNKLMNSVCASALFPPLDWKLCYDQLFAGHGNMGTRLELSIADGDGNKIRKHWAYAPFLTSAKYTWTPKDLVPVPVNREDCTKGDIFNNSEPLLPDEEYVNITWEIVYSGLSPAQLIISEAMRAAPIYNMTDTEANRQAEQAQSEMLQGLRGHRLSEDKHPRRMAFVYTLVVMMQFVSASLDLLYWYTRSSTVGLSKFSVTLVAVLNLGHFLLTAFSQDYKSFPDLVRTIIGLPFQAVPFLMLKVVWRIRVGWGQCKGKGKWTEKEPKRWGRTCFPRLNFVKATHRERASDRLDGSISLTVKFALFISCSLAYFFLSPNTSFLIPPRGLSIPKAGKFWLRDIIRSIVPPGIMVGAVFQLWFNHQSHTFAGQYQFLAIFEVVRDALDMLKFSTRMLGNIDVREGFSVFGLMGSIILVVWCWQAIMLPKVSQGETDDEAE